MKSAPIFKTLLLLATLGLTSALHAEIPALLKEALANEEAQAGRWAYTETHVIRDKKGVQKSVTVIRHDPSRPYAEQHKPLSIDGAPPSKKEVKKYSDLGEQEAAARQKALEQADPATKNPPRIVLGSAQGVVDLEHPAITAEDDQTITYKIPVVAEGKSSFPFDQIQVLLRVNKQQQAFENIRLILLAPFRIKLIAKVKSAEISADFAPVAADFPPQVTSVNVHAKVAVLFAKIDDREELTRTDFKHVKPYDERFSVTAGPLKALGF